MKALMLENMVSCVVVNLYTFALHTYTSQIHDLNLCL